MSKNIREIHHSIDANEYYIPDYEKTRDKMLSVVEEKLTELCSEYSMTCLTTLVADDATRTINSTKDSMDKDLTDEECFNIIQQLNLTSSRLTRMTATMRNERKHPL